MKKQLESILKPERTLRPIPTDISSRGTELKGIKAVIFDIYGTLIISGSGDVGTAMNSGSPEAFKKALLRSGIAEPSIAAANIVKTHFFNQIASIHEKMRNEGIPYPEVDIIEVWREVFNASDVRRIIPESVSISPEIIAAQYESIVNPTYPMPGASELLDILVKEGFKLGIVSNAQFYTPIIIKTMFNRDLSGLGFTSPLCLFSYIEKRSKPDTHLFKKLSGELENFGISPEESIFIGNDMLKDIYPSASTGFKTALFAGDKRSLRLHEDHDACKNLKPDVIVNKLLDLISYIQEG